MEKRRRSSETVIFFQPTPRYPQGPTWYHSFLGSTCKTTSASPAAAATTRSSEKSCAGTPQCCGGRPASVAQGQRASGSGNNLARWASDVEKSCFDERLYTKSLEAGTQEKQLGGRSRKEDLFKVSLTTKYILDIPLSCWQRSNALSASHASHHSMPDVFQHQVKSERKSTVISYITMYVFMFADIYNMCVNIYALYIQEI